MVSLRLNCRSTFVPGCHSQIDRPVRRKFDKVKLRFQHVDNRFEMPQMEAVGDVVQFHALVAALVQVLTDFSMKLLANLDRACAERTLAAHEGSHIEPKGPWTGSASVAKGTPCYRSRNTGRALRATLIPASCNKRRISISSNRRYLTSKRR
jgi:hypothetical protein